MRRTLTAGMAAALLASALPVTAARADRRALAILNRVEARTKALGTLTADWTYTVAFPDRVLRDEGSVILKKPNYAAIAYDPDTPASRRIISDGTTLWTFYPPTDSYWKVPADPRGQNIRVGDSLVIQAFFNAFTAVKQSAHANNDLSDLHYAGTERLDEVSYRILERRTNGTLANGAPSPFVQRIYVGPDDLIHRYVLKFRVNGRPGSEIAELQDIRAGAPLSASAFTFTPPTPSEAQAPPPAMGTPAPDFIALDRRGDDWRLSEYRDKVVVLNFWATWWAPRTQPTAHIRELAALARKYADRDVVVLAVDTWDTADAWRAWLTRHPEITGITQLRDPATRGKDIASMRYGVSALPATFVINRDGSIVGAFSGDTDTATIEDALKAAGVTPPE
ncbi:MAG: redoxin domain-containing protein [Armatimonadetes bacterium]|nr:redoxin domain-containing protein [Armatimonadota bacterium]